MLITNWLPTGKLVGSERWETDKTKKRCFKAHRYAAPMSPAMRQAAW
jgi:hypothetical protein